MVAKNRYSSVEWLGFSPDEPTLWDEGETVPRATYTSHDAAIMLGGIDQKTLRRWAAAAGIRPEGPTTPDSGQRTPEDKRVLGWTYGELKHIADFKQRQLGKPPAESDTARVRRLEAEVAQLRHLIESHIANHAHVARSEGQQATSNEETEHAHVARAPRPTVRLTSMRDTLPEGWEAVSVWADRYKIPLRTITEAYKPSKPDRQPITELVPHRGPYRRGRVEIRNAWDEEQQAFAKQHWQRLGRIPADDINT